MEEVLVERERRLDDRARSFRDQVPDFPLRQQQTIDRVQAALGRGDELLYRAQAALDRSRRSLERDTATVAREVQATTARRMSEGLGRPV